MDVRLTLLPESQAPLPLEKVPGGIPAPLKGTGVNLWETPVIFFLLNRGDPSFRSAARNFIQDDNRIWLK